MFKLIIPKIIWFVSEKSEKNYVKSSKVDNCRDWSQRIQTFRAKVLRQRKNRVLKVLCSKRRYSLRSITTVMNLWTFYLIYHCLRSILFLYHWKKLLLVAQPMASVLPSPRLSLRTSDQGFVGPAQRCFPYINEREFKQTLRQRLLQRLLTKEIQNKSNE